MARHGLTKIEIIVILAVVAIIIALVLPALKKSRCGAASMRDKSQISQIHKATTESGSSNNGVFPLPGMAAQHAGAASEHDYSQNHSAPLYSYMVATKLVKPEILVSPLNCIDESPAVRIKKNYNYDAYKPATNSFWDPTFQIRIDDVKIGSNVSYAHSALCGDRIKPPASWRKPSMHAVFGNRGTRDGVSSGPEYERSPTLRLHGPRRMWVGHVVFADNHAETLDSFFTGNAIFRSDDEVVRDNIYAAEFSHPNGNQAAADSYLGIFIGSTEFTVDPIYDPLD